MEILTYKRRGAMIATALFATALTGCSVDSYLTDPSDVQCDGRRTKVDLVANSMVTFIVHGEQKGNATVKVRRSEEGASVGVSGNVTGPPQRLEADGFTSPTPIVDGAEFNTFGAGGVWLIDVREDSVVIQGSCDGM